MSADRKPLLPLPVVLVIGILLMVAGMYVSKNVHIAALDTLSEQGIMLDLGKTIASIGVLIILFPVINAFYVRPLEDAIESRNSQLEKTFTEAETLRAEMTSMKAAYEERLKETEANARAQIQAQIQEAQALRKSLMDDAASRADTLVKKAQEEIAAERDRVLADLRVSTVTLALNATERLLGANIDDEKNRKLIEEFIDKAEVPA